LPDFANSHKITAVTAGWSSLVARRAHNPKVVGSNPAPATTYMKKTKAPYGVFVYKGLILQLWVECMGKINPALQERLEKIITAMGTEWVGSEVVLQGRQTVFRLYIDAPGGVTIEDCSKVSRQVKAMLDVEEVFPGHYVLEVSSPGLDRPLFELKHYSHFIGRQIRIRLRLPINERLHYKGILQRVEGEEIYLLMDDVNKEVKLPFAAIEKANLVG
jgi:ribosome maturation factor RimP